MKSGKNEKRNLLGGKRGVVLFSAVSAGLLVFCGPVIALAHGTLGKRVEKEAVCLAFAYDDEPMRHVQATITGPGGEAPFQSLATDRHGTLCFAPDSAGEWRVVAGDGMGHRQMMVISVAEGEGKKPVTSPSSLSQATRAEKLSRAFAGIGIIGALVGGLAWHRSRRRR